MALDTALDMALDMAPDTFLPAPAPGRAAALARALGLALLGAAAVAAPAGAHADDGPVHLDFGVYSSNKPSAMVRTFKPTLNRLEESMSERLGREVDIRMRIAKDYDQGIADLTDGRVDFSHFGPSSYVEAKRVNPDLGILAMESIKRSKVFHGIIAVHEDSEIADTEGLRGSSFAFGDEGSTIGRFLSQLWLERHDVRAGDLEKYAYLGRHDKVGAAVAAGEFDAGALNEKTFDKLVAAGEPLRELARFPNVTKPWIASSSIDPEVRDALRASLLELDDARALGALKVDGFLPGDDTDYASIRTAMEDNDRFFAARVSKAPTREEHAAKIVLERDADRLRVEVHASPEVLARVEAAGASRIAIELVGDGDVSVRAAPALGAAVPTGPDVDAADEAQD